MCSVCQRIMPVTTAGLVRVHGPVSNRCPGSRNPPTVTSTAAPASISALTTDSLQEQGPVTQQLADPTIQSSVVPGLRSSTSQDQSSPNTTPSPPPPRPNTLPPLHIILGMKTSTLHHVPKGVRDAWARLVSEVLRAISADPSDLDAWRKIFMLPRCILANPVRGGRSHWRDTEKTVRNRIRRWRAGDILGLWSEVEVGEDRLNHRRGRPKKVTSESSRVANARRARRAMEDGQYKKAIQSLTSDGLAPASAEVYEEMLAKHPQSPHPPSPATPAPTPVQITAEGLAKALKSFPSGSAPGPSSFRPTHFKEAVFCPSPDRANRALLALLDVINLMGAGDVPSMVVPHLCGASLLASKKKGGGVRPIAVGEVLRRLTSKCISRAVRSDASRILTPTQVGVGVPCGCEAIVLAVARVQEDAATPPEGRWTLLLDFSNAFNRVDRGSMFQEVRDRIPSMAAWMEMCYGAQSFLHLGCRTILSCCGVQQGDPLGPLGFALALHPIVEKIHEQVPGLLINAWYLDDGTLCGSATDLHAALTIIEEDGPTRGLHLNRSKSLLYIPTGAPSDTNTLPADIPIVRGGFDLLGSPIGPSSYCEGTVLNRVKKVQEVLARLPDLQDSQMETTLLRSCLALPKVAFALRTCPPSHIKEATTAFDNAMREALSDLVGLGLAKGLPPQLSGWAHCPAGIPPCPGCLPWIPGPDRPPHRADPELCSGCFHT